MASTISKNPNPTTPPYEDDLTYAETYLAIHMMSSPSYRYVYLFWFGIILVFLVFALLHWTGKRGGTVGALWSKWTLRRRTWRKKQALEMARKNPTAHRQPFSFPSNAQLLSFFLLTVFSLCACFIGPDYIAPSARLWQFHAEPDVLTQPSQPNSPPVYTIQKAWWTVGGRTGIIAFSLFPLVVLFALKAPPFALLSLPFFLQLHFDKLSRIHRWSGNLVWLITTIHVVTWAVQLARDKRVGVDDQSLWVSVWLYNKFVYGCLAYFCLTLLVLLSLPVVRAAYYEAFYALHILLVPLTLAMSAFHFPHIGWWCWVSLGIWLGERLWRLVRVGWVNGHFLRPRRAQTTDIDQAWEMDDGLQERQWIPSHTSTYSEQFDISMYAEPGIALLPENPIQQSAKASVSIDGAIPPGFGWAHLLPGRTIRLRIVTHRVISWSPGQHVLLRVPSISKFTTHPFTIASTFHQNGDTTSYQSVELLIRAKSGFTRDLWNEVYRLSSTSRSQAPLQPTIGALLKAELDGPFGSVSRTRWGNFSTILIICGGSGVSFGISVLEFLCLCMSGQKPGSLGSSPGGLGYSSFQTRRVRFIWLVREYSHLQWCAATLFRCSKMLPADSLEVDIFVTNTSQSIRQRHRNSPLEQSILEPPTPSFAQSHHKRNSWASGLSVDSEDDLGSPATPTSTVYSVMEESDSHPLDLTNFDGDDDSFMPGEAQLSYQVRRAGHLRRRETRRRNRNHPDKTVRLVNDSLKAPFYIHGGENTQATASSQDEFDPNQPFAKQERQGLSSAHHLTSPAFTASHDPIMQFGREVRSQTSFLQIERDEACALMAISEIARSGKPQLDPILKEEVENSRGAIGVACCGPTSLNAMVRKIVAAKIDPARVRAGDCRGSIALISEDFDY